MSLYIECINNFYKSIRKRNINGNMAKRFDQDDDKVVIFNLQKFIKMDPVIYVFCFYRLYLNTKMFFQELLVLSNGL